MASSDENQWEDIPSSPQGDQWEDLPPPAHPGLAQSVVGGLVKGAGAVSEAFDSQFNAPLRAGVGEFQRSGSPVNAYLAAKIQADKGGQPPPSWKDIMANTGLSKDESISIPNLAQPTAQGEGRWLHASPAGVAGGVMATVTDPLTYSGLPIKGAAGAIPEAASGIASDLKGFAAERAVKQATGQSKAAIREAAGVTTKGGNIARAESNLKDLGTTLNTTDEAGPAVLSPSARDTALKAGQKREYFGSKIGEIGQEIDKEMPRSVSGQKISEQLLNYATTIPETEGGKALQNRIMAEAQNVQKMGNMSFADAQNLKGQFKFKNDAQDALISNQDATNKIRGLISDEMDNTVDMLKDNLKPDLLGKYQDYKSKYGAYKQAEGAATQNAMSQLSNRFIEPSTYAMGATGALAAATATHNPVATLGALLVGGAANKIGKTYGSYAASKIANGIAQTIIDSPKTFGKWLPSLVNASARGPAALELSHHLLMQNDPEYAKTFQSQGAGQ